MHLHPYEAVHVRLYADTRRTLFAVGARGSVACPTICEAAPNATVLVTGRLLQHAAAAPLIPQGLGILRSVDPARDPPAQAAADWRNQP